MSEFGVRKVLLIKKVPTRKMGALIFKSILRKYRVLASFMSRKGTTGGAGFVKTQAPSRIPLMIKLSKSRAMSPKVKEPAQT